MAQRYNVMSYSVDEDNASGPFVKYEDYAALEIKLAAVHSHLERAKDSAPHMCAGYVKMALRELNND